MPMGRPTNKGQVLQTGPRLAAGDPCSDDDLLPEDLDEVF